MWSVMVRDESARCTDACWIIPFVICLGLFIFVCSDAGTSAVKLRVPRAADFVCKLLGVEMKMNHMSRDVTRDSRMSGADLMDARWPCKSSTHGGPRRVICCSML